MLLRLVEGDITERKVDVIVNAANSYLMHGGGVAGAIVRKGGKIIQEESRKIGFVKVGSSVITSSGNLPCKAVIHTVGPTMGEGNEDEKLSNAINSCLELATQKAFKSISIPAISSGIFGFPKDRCAKIFVNETMNFLTHREDSPSNIKIVEFCLLDIDLINIFQKEFENLKKNNSTFK
ncbi:MAG: macro domain-containing protein [Thermoproteota archaeon]|nr:macro domain-containing protein [Thermoproteota archaeon]